MERRLAAILAADLVGYARMIRADEDGTLAAFEALRSALIEPALDAHGGRLVKVMGDGMLVAFSSAVGAVEAAVEIQQALAGRNAGRPEGERLRFRIGINLGDVVVDGEDIHGDGVNLAARLEGLAAPGAVCVSEAVHDQVRNRLQLAFEDLDAWEAYQRGMWHSYRFTAADNAEAQALFHRAVARDGAFAPGHAGLAYALYLSVMLGFSGDVEAAMAEAVASAERAVALDGEDALGQATLGRVRLMMGEHGAALSAFEKALALNPNYASAHYGLAMTLVYSGRPEESLAAVERAIRLSPRDPMLWGFLIVKGQAHLSLGRLEEALTWMREAAG